MISLVKMRGMKKDETEFNNLFRRFFFFSRLTLKVLSQSKSSRKTLGKTTIQRKLLSAVK